MHSSNCSALNLSISSCWISSETKKNSRKEPNVPFPPARPTTHNLAAICHQGRGRPRYPPSFFPKSGSSHFRRRGHAMNRLESWFRVCCSGHLEQSSQILCCAQQAVSLWVFGTEVNLKTLSISSGRVLLLFTIYTVSRELIILFFFFFLSFIVLKFMDCPRGFGFQNYKFIQISIILKNTTQ